MSRKKRKKKRYDPRETFPDTPLITVRTSQIVNIPIILLALLLYVLINNELILTLIISYSIFRILDTYCRVYRVFQNRIEYSWGVLSRRTNNVFNYRIKDIAVEKPFLLRILFRGHVIVHTSGVETGILRMEYIPKVDKIREVLLVQSERGRRKNGVREVDLWSPKRGGN